MIIVYTIPGSSIGGGVNVVLEHANRLCDRGHTVIVLNLIGELNTQWNPLHKFTSLTRFKPQHISYIRSLDVDVVVATGWQTVYELNKLNLTARSFVYFLQADEVEFNHPGSLDRQLSAATRACKFDYITCATWLKSLAPDADATPIINGVNEDIFFKDTPLVAKGHKPRVLIEGPISQPRKRISDAFLTCEPFRSQLEVWCVSSGGHPSAWFKPDLFLTRVPMVGMRRIYSACDIIIKLSSAEGMFGPPLEMMACGGTAITSDCDGHEEYMKDDVNGLVVPVGDIAAAQGALKRLLTEVDTLDRLKKAGYETSCAFSWDVAVDKLESFFIAKSRGQQSKSMREFLSYRGSSVSAELMRLYFEQSYGTLAAPTQLGSSGLLIPRASAAGCVNVLRLKGWVHHSHLSTSQTTLIIYDPESGREQRQICTIERPDIHYSSDVPSYPGFDVLYRFPDRSLRDCKIVISIDIEVEQPGERPKRVGKLVSMLPEMAGSLELLGTTEEMDHEFVGVVEFCEFLTETVAVGHKASHVSVDDLTCYLSPNDSDGFLFYQETALNFFENKGVLVNTSNGKTPQVVNFTLPRHADNEALYSVFSTQTISLSYIIAGV
jgi:glycosyltransferase involved in cell wall biosynthesis